MGADRNRGATGVAPTPLRRVGPLTTAALLAAQASGCTAPDREGGGGERVLRADSAGIEVVVNRAPAWGEGEGWRVDPEPLLQIGRIEGPEDETLHGIVSVRRAGDQLLVALQTELRLYDGSGAFVRRLGGAGQGPGEFSRVAAALPCEGRILAAELSPPRLISFDAAGQPRAVLLPPPPTQGLLNPLSPLHACTPGGVVGSMAGPRAPPSDPPVVRRNPQLLVHLHEADARLDTLLRVPGSEVYDGLTVPFGRQTLLAAGDTLLYMADTGAPEIRVLGVDGGVRRIVRLALPARAVTPADVARIREQYLGGLSAILLAEVGPRLDAVPMPSTLPYFSALRVAPDGTMALQAYQPFRDEEVTRWTVVAASGEWLGDMELPSGLAVHDFGVGEALGVWRDEYGVEYVRVHAIRD